MFRATIAYVIFVILLPQHVLTRLSEGRRSKPFSDGGRLNFTSLATKYGYSSVQYDVITEDGYILTLFRLPGERPLPVLILHGILESADDWILRGKNSLIIALANSGYDVWVANSRGNRYSRRHVTLDPDRDATFWKFSFNEIGRYDLPAIVDKVLQETRAPNLTAIGHSQGTSSFFVLGATRPEYNSKINVFIALAPIAYMYHCPPPVSTIIRISPLLGDVLHALNINELLGDTTWLSKIWRLICPSPVVGYTVCGIEIVFPTIGFDISEMEPSFFSVFAEYFPAGTSTRSFLHYMQLGNSRTFGQYDNGPESNLLIYNSTTPPAYDLSKVSMPVALFTADNDRLSTVPDVALLRQQLPNVVYNLLNPRKLFNHLDYIVGRHMRNYLFPYIFDVIQRYNTD